MHTTRASKVSGASTNSEHYWTTMRDSEKCFVPEVKELVRLIDLPQSSHLPVVPRTRRIKNLDDLNNYINEATNDDYSCRVISMCQINSWAPLQMTKPMMERIIQHHDIDASFLEVPQSFYSRRTEQEQAHCVPFTMFQAGDSCEMFYTFRYPEFKGRTNEPWVIRQMGVYQKLNLKSKQSLWILVNAAPETLAENRVFSCLQHEQVQLSKNMLWLHAIIHQSYMMQWREYLKSFEAIILPIANTTVATFIEEPLRINHETLGKLHFLESRFLPVNAILVNYTDILSELKGLVKTMTATRIISHEDRKSAERDIENKRKACAGFVRNAHFLQRRCESTAQLLSNTLAFKNQVVAQEQNHSMLRLTKSAVFLTILTVFYLPWSFVATFFGMNFFVMEAETLRLKASPMVWIYVLSSVVLTVVTGMLYYFVTLPNGSDNTVETVTPDEHDEKRRIRNLLGVRRRLQGAIAVSSPPGV